MKRRDYFWSLLTVIMVAMLNWELSSCGNDDDELEQTENISAQDPEGTIVMNMNRGSRDHAYYIGGDYIYLDEANNFGSYNQSSFVSVGLVGGLGKITQIPKSGWASSAAVVPGTGYVMCYRNTYARIYVVDNITSSTTEGYGYTLGATIKYQSPFYGEDEIISIPKKTLSFDSGGGSEDLFFNNKSIVPFTIESSENWCLVENLGVKNGIRISVYANKNTYDRTATITLTTGFNRKTTINVTQYGQKSK